MAGGAVPSANGHRRPCASSRLGGSPDRFERDLDGEWRPRRPLSFLTACPILRELLRLTECGHALTIALTEVVGRPDALGPRAALSVGHPQHPSSGGLVTVVAGRDAGEDGFFNHWQAQPAGPSFALRCARVASHSVPSTCLDDRTLGWTSQHLERHERCYTSIACVHDFGPIWTICLALSRRKHGFDSPRTRQGCQALGCIVRQALTGYPSGSDARQADPYRVTRIICGASKRVVIARARSPSSVRRVAREPCVADRAAGMRHVDRLVPAGRS